MPIKYLDEKFINKKVNIVNSENEELKKIGLLPKNVFIRPVFINLSKLPVYITSDHFGSNLNNDVEYCINIMQHDFNNQIQTLEKKETAYSLFLKEYEKQEKHNEKITDSYNITDFIVAKYINERANIFEAPFYYPRNTKGIYNNNALEIINSLKKSKKNIYNFIKNIITNSNDLEETLSNLLKSFELIKNIENLKKANSDEHWSRILQFLTLDILIQLIGFDKIEIKINKTITTCKSNINKEFFNYLIMDYNIVQLPKIVFNKDKNDFDIIKPYEFLRTNEEKEYEEEINLIKKLVPIKDRHKYFIE